MLAASRVDYATPVTWAGASIVDCHHHLRPSPEANIAHLDGAGISNALALARANSAEQMQTLEAKYPGRISGLVRQHGHHQAGGRGPAHQSGEERRDRTGRDQVSRGGRRAGTAPDVRTGGRAERSDPDPFPGSAAHSDRGRLQHRIQELRGHAQGVSEDKIHRARRRLLGERERRLRECRRLSHRARSNAAA